MKAIIKQHSEYPKQVIIRSLTGDFTKDELIQSWKDLTNNPLFNSSIKGVITDLSQANINITMHELEEIIDFLKTQKKLLPVKHAIIATSPKSVVYPMMASRLTVNVKIMPFSTIQAAASWIIC